MAGQRRSEPRGLGGGGLSRLGRLALALPLLLIAADGCGDAGPTGPQRPRNTIGSSDQETPAGRLAGTWRGTAIVEVPADVQAWITTWQFDRDGTCLQTQEVRSVLDTVPRITERRCTFTADGFTITIAFTGGTTVTFNYSLSPSSPDVLILNGLRYERLTP